MAPGVSRHRGPCECHSGTTEHHYTLTESSHTMTTTSYRRSELGVDMICHVDGRGWTEIVATGGYTDAASIFDHTAFSGSIVKSELRNALRRHARHVKAAQR